MKGVFVTGTDTGVGKTWVGVHLINALKTMDVDVIPRKPVESGWDSDIKKTDAWKLANAANKLNELESICPNRLTLAVSPARAARAENRMLTIEILTKQCLDSLYGEGFLYVEGAGGFYSPLAADGLNCDLAKALDLPIILVAENRLGSINQVLLSVNAIRHANLSLSAIVLNQTNVIEPPKYKEKDQLILSNLKDIQALVDVPVFSTKHDVACDQLFEELAKITLTNKK